MTFAREGPGRRSDWLSRAILSGFVATVVMLFTVVAAYGIGLLLADIQLADKRGAEMIGGWFRGLISNPIVDFARHSFYLAVAVHFTVGLLWALAYGYAGEPRLSGPGWQRGALFSFVPWGLSLVVFLPIAGGGFLGQALGAGPLPIVGNLIAHLAYGCVLGLVYGPFGDVVLSESGRADSEEEARALARSQRLTATGIVAGMAAGVLVGFLMSLAAPLSAAQRVLDIPNAAFVVASLLLGGAIGGVIGSLAGLTATGGKG